jgi:predicted Zn finger-like uncharacterized protein
MKITCPHCGVVGSAHSSMPGKKVRCPQCEKVFTVTEQKIACPHCGVMGSANDSSIDTKLRCPQCEKVFLLTQELLAGSSIKDAVMAESTDELKSALVTETSSIDSPAEEEIPFPVHEPEQPILAPVDEVQTESEKEITITPETGPELELNLVSEPEIEPETALMAVAVSEPEFEREIEDYPVLEPETATESESDLAVVTTPESEQEPGVESVPEPVNEFEPELKVADTPETELQVESEGFPVSEPDIEAEEAESDLAVVATPEPEIIPKSDLDTILPIEDEKSPEDIKAEDEAEELETALPTRVCDGCGDSFHPEFLQEVEYGKLHCGVCQLRTAAAEARENSPTIGDGRLRGTLAALLLLGLLAFAVMALKMLGFI